MPSSSSSPSRTTLSSLRASARRSLAQITAEMAAMNDGRQKSGNLGLSATFLFPVPVCFQRTPSRAAIVRVPVCNVQSDPELLSLVALR